MIIERTKSINITQPTRLAQDKIVGSVENELINPGSYERNPYTWVDDKMIVNCYHCNSSFTWYLRKHHCRSCGRIFCYYCIRNKIKIPYELFQCNDNNKNWNISSLSFDKFLQWGGDHSDMNSEPVCGKCFKNIHDFNSMRCILNVFKHFDLYTLKKFSLVCTIWNKASKYWINKLKNIQYKIPTFKFSKIEKQMLWNNRYYFANHSRWILQLLKSFSCINPSEIFRIIQSEKTNKCINLGCNENKCKHNIQPNDVLELLNHPIKDPSIRKYIIECLFEATNQELLCYIPILVYNLKYELKREKYLLYALIEKCKQSAELLIDFYWSLNVIIDEMINEHNLILHKFYVTCKYILLNRISTKDRLLVKNTETSIDAIANSSYQIIRINNQFYLPINFPKPYIHISNDKTLIKNSFNKPLIIPLILSTNETKRILYKTSDIRKDKIVCNIIKLLHMLLKKDRIIDIDIVTYSVFPINSTSGIIEIVDNAITLQYIQNQGFTIQNYILEHNSSSMDNLKIIKNNFITSTAFYTVISYILGFGDRHLDNIMITTNGSLFHIDFDYILGSDPKFNPASIRITPCMIDMIGGKNSYNYVCFKKLCINIYNYFRSNINVIIKLLTIISKYDPDITLDNIESQIIHRLEYGENLTDSCIHFENILNNNYESLSLKVSDYIHNSSRNRIL